jgi:mannose-6-phosphate isomerase-like protein (cupin superfamily)
LFHLNDGYPLTKPARKIQEMKMAFNVAAAIQRFVSLKPVAEIKQFGVSPSAIAARLHRRDLSAVLFTCAAIAGVACEAQTAAVPGATGDQLLSQPRVFLLDQIPTHKMANGGESRNIVHGALPTGEVVALHESVLPVGSVPNPPHKIEHSEFIVVVEGKVAFEHDGKSERVGQGDAILVANGVLHTLRNAGDVPAKYVVVAIGGDTKP